MIVFAVLGGLLILINAACGIVFLIAAFMDEVWKGVLALFCGVYLLYWVAAEYEHEYKWYMIAVWLGSGVIGGALFRFSGSAMGWE